MNVLPKVNELHKGCLLDMTPHGAYIIPIHVHTMTLAEINHKQKD